MGGAKGGKVRGFGSFCVICYMYRRVGASMSHIASQLSWERNGDVHSMHTSYIWSLPLKGKTPAFLVSAVITSSRTASPTPLPQRFCALRIQRQLKSCIVDAGGWQMTQEKRNRSRRWVGSVLGWMAPLPCRRRADATILFHQKWDSARHFPSLAFFSI